MPRGNWDYGVNPSGVITAPEISSAELAARVTPVSVYDRLGELFYAESFDGGLDSWDQTVSGTGAAVNLSAGHGILGPYCGVLVGGSDASRSAQIARSFVFPFLVPVGLEFSWSLDADLQEAIAYLDIYTGALQLRWGIRYAAADGKNYIWVATAAWQQIGSAQQNPADVNLFVPTKFVVDPNTTGYKRFRVGPLDLAVSAYGAEIAVSATLPHMRITGLAISNPGANTEASFDRIILTTNEP